MRKCFTALLACLPMLLRAHVGSPNVFFEGQAGPYPVRVIIRPPAVLPGAAQVDVRAEGASRVSLQAALWGAGAQAAEAVTATAVTGESNLFNAVVWFFFSGAYSVQVRVEGDRGGGTAVVPITSAALRQPSMSPVLAGALIALGFVLLAWAVWLVGATARATLPQLPARIVTVMAAVIFAGTIYAGKVRWQKMDSEFRNNAVAKPVPVLASTHTNGNLRLLRLAPGADVAGTTWDTLAADHGKLMHLFLLRAPDFNAFAHLHPVRRDAQSFENVLPPLPAGDYQLYAEVTHDNGLNQTLIARVALPEPSGRVPQMILSSNMVNDVICQSPLLDATNGAQPFALDADDSWHTTMGTATVSATPAKTARLMGGLNMTFQNTEELIENRETSLRFQVLTADGQPATLQPYMGMLGHAVLRRDGGEVFTHLHPVGSISMAAQELFALQEGGPVPGPRTNALPATSVVSFPYAFPRPGNYRLWAQVRVKGRVLTGAFDVQVKPAR